MTTEPASAAVDPSRAAPAAAPVPDTAVPAFLAASPAAGPSITNPSVPGASAQLPSVQLPSAKPLSTAPLSTTPDPVPPSARVRLALVGLALVLAFLVLAPVQVLANRFHPATARRLPGLFHRLGLAVLGVRVRVTGRPAAGRPLLLVSNHVSWLDILVLSAVTPVSFIAKGEVAGWPVFGTLARLQRTLFVDRARRSATGRAAEAIAQRLRAGDAMVLFPEGTTGDGTHVQPFRTALLGAARAAVGGEGAGAAPEEGEGTALPVPLAQPVAIAYLRSRGLPLGRTGRLEAAWIGSADLLPHLAVTAALAPLEVEVVFGTPRPAGPEVGRKDLARALEAEVRAGLATALAGRAGG